MESLEIQEETRVVRFIEFDGKRFYSDNRGYWVTNTKDKKGTKKRLHVYIWEKYNGEVPEGYHVHHVDGDKGNNDISNLTLMNQSEHMRYHNNADEMKAMFRKNIDKYARPKAIEWHKSAASTEFHKEHWKNSIGKYVGIYEKKNCAYCGKEFDAPILKPNTKFCSSKCKGTARRKNRKDDVEKVCVMCGNKFMGNKHNGVKTCSHNCRTALTNKTKEEKYGKSKRYIPPKQ